MEKLKYAEIISKNRELGDRLSGPSFKLLILSNIVILQLKEILEFCLRTHGINAVVSFGNYDNIVQDSVSVGDFRVVIVFWEPANLVDGLQYRADMLGSDELRALGERLDAEVATVLRNVVDVPLVIFNLPSTLPFTAHELRATQFSSIAVRANATLHATQRPNLILVETDAVLAQTGLRESVDLRLFASSRSLYTTAFFGNWVDLVLPAIMSAAGKAKKVLILDCDNTLWKGVVGEDGFDGIDMSPESRAGQAFAEVQALVLRLQRQGVIIGLCSKNNPQDVEEVLERHPHMLLRHEHLAGCRINWDDKITNLRSLAEEWNLGLDSFVFVDDSDFELGLVRAALPEVTTIKVPEQISMYPQVIRRHLGLFFQLSVSDEDAKKTLLYRQEHDRVHAQKAFTNIDDYLRSLELTLSIHERPASMTSRLAQMTQKTNQFNLTTRRYTEADIARVLRSNRHLLLAIGVSDKYGDYGIIGEAIVEFEDTKRSARIDTFLMSCRALGRNIEFAFMQELIERLRVIGFQEVEAEYLRTDKNAMIADFLDRSGFELIEAAPDRRRYVVTPLRFQSRALDYIRVERRIETDDIAAPVGYGSP